MIFEVLSNPNLVALVMLGTALGITVGAIPGLTGAMLISLSLPLTFSMAPQSALAFLVAMYVGSVSGGLITATLLRMPGTPASIITTLDGYPMAQSGQAGPGARSRDWRLIHRRDPFVDCPCSGGETDRRVIDRTWALGIFCPRADVTGLGGWSQW